ncbi:MAG: HD domain-containing protein [Deltaproteobacteria bacterium]|nr:HD domain-containing protein [Deltaproteobacteria bacterium]
MGAYPHQEPIFGFTGPVARGVAVGILMVAITVALLSLPEQSEQWIRSREMVRKLYLFPILLCASWFGGAGAALSTVGATAVCAGLAGSSWPSEVSGQVARIGEVGVFWLVGALAASFFEQQKRFIRDIETANDNTLLALASALDIREHSTGVHSQRVADYTLRLAKEMRITSREELDVIWRGALLHDMGKIGIPDNILLKPGPLTEEEWKVMRTHPEVGSRMLRKIDFLRKSSAIVLSHHERFDGKGYPRGLQGSHIPLGARLFAVIDVYDALTTDRVYHTGRTHAEALENITDGAGSRFDPEVVAAFRKIPFDELREIARNNETPLLLSPASTPSMREAASAVLSPQP